MCCTLGFMLPWDSAPGGTKANGRSRKDIRGRSWCLLQCQGLCSPVDRSWSSWTSSNRVMSP